MAVGASAILASAPHAPGDVLLLGADRVGVDGSGGKLGVIEPSLHQVERDAGGGGGHPEALPQSLGRGVRPVKPGAPMTACTARQPVIRDQGHNRTPRPRPRSPCSSRTPCAMTSASSRAGGTGTARWMPPRRFFRLSNTTVPAPRSTRSAMRASASDKRQPL